MSSPVACYQFSRRFNQPTIRIWSWWVTWHRPWSIEWRQLPLLLFNDSLLLCKPLCIGSFLATFFIVESSNTFTMWTQFQLSSIVLPFEEIWHSLSRFWINVERGIDIYLNFLLSCYIDHANVQRNFSIIFSNRLTKWVSVNLHILLLFVSKLQSSFHEGFLNHIPETHTFISNITECIVKFTIFLSLISSGFNSLWPSTT